jgi:TPR repeat protein
MHTKTRRDSRNKRKTTRRKHKKGGGPKIDPSKEKKKEVKLMAHSLVPAAQPHLEVQSRAFESSCDPVRPPPLTRWNPYDRAAHPRLPMSFVPSARDLLLADGGHADFMLSHLGIPKALYNKNPLSMTRVPLERENARVMIDAMHDSADRLWDRGDFANARVQLDRALALGSTRARVELADMLYDGRIGISCVEKDKPRAHALLYVDDPVVRTNPDCMGLRAFFKLEEGDEDEAEWLSDANKSAVAHSKYGMFALAKCFLAQKQPGVVSWYLERSVNEGYYDRAQDALGSMWMGASKSPGIPAIHRPSLTHDTMMRCMDLAQDQRDAAFGFFYSAACQGLPIAMFHMGDFYRTEAIRLRTMVDAANFHGMTSNARYWYQRSQLPCNVQLDELDEMDDEFEIAMLQSRFGKMKL